VAAALGPLHTEQHHALAAVHRRQVRRAVELHRLGAMRQRHARHVAPAPPAFGARLQPVHQQKLRARRVAVLVGGGGGGERQAAVEIHGGA